MKDKVLAAYSKLSKDYEKNVDTASGFNAYYERPAMMKLLPNDMNGLAILDAGWYTDQFIKRGANVTAMDLIPEMVQATKRRIDRRGNGANVFVQDLTEPLPICNEEFNIVFSSLTLDYIDEDNWNFMKVKFVPESKWKEMEGSMDTELPQNDAGSSIKRTRQDSE